MCETAVVQHTAINATILAKFVLAGEGDENQGPNRLADPSWDPNEDLFNGMTCAHLLTDVVYVELVFIQQEFRRLGGERRIIH
jgi:hypothetical protein